MIYIQDLMFHTTHLFLAVWLYYLFLHLKSAIKKISKYFNKNQQRLILFNCIHESSIKQTTLVAILVLLRLLTTIEVAGSSANRSSRSAIPYSDTSNRLLNANAVKKKDNKNFQKELYDWSSNLVVLLKYVIKKVWDTSISWHTFFQNKQ